LPALRYCGGKDRFCSPTDAWPKSAGLPPCAAHVDALNWYSL
jgi:hypothetical protein